MDKQIEHTYLLFCLVSLMACYAFDSSIRSEQLWALPQVYRFPLYVATFWIMLVLHFLLEILSHFVWMHNIFLFTTARIVSNTSSPCWLMILIAFGARLVLFSGFCYCPLMESVLIVKLVDSTNVPLVIMRSADSGLSSYLKFWNFSKDCFVHVS